MSPTTGLTLHLDNVTLLELRFTPDTRNVHSDGLATLPDGSKGAWFKDTEGNLIAVGSM